MANGELREQAQGAPSLYVGECSRSIEERASEHWGAARRKEETSHMSKHQIMEHGGAPPEFVFKVISYHKTPLNRQIKEAIMIRRRGGATEILNSHSEFNRCHIPRLVVEVEEEGIRKAREQKEEEEIKELIRSLESEELSWEERKKHERHLAKKKRRRGSETEDQGAVEGAKFTGGGGKS